MSTSSLHISLPEALRDYALDRVKEGAFSNPSDYVRTLIREDRKRQAEERLEALLLEGLASGEAEPADWPALRATAYRLAGAKSASEA